MLTIVKLCRLLFSASRNLQFMSYNAISASYSLQLRSRLCGEWGRSELVMYLLWSWNYVMQNTSLPFNKYAWLTTHNSFAIFGSPSESGVPIITFFNQEDSVLEQLNVKPIPILLGKPFGKIEGCIRLDWRLCSVFSLGDCHADISLNTVDSTALLIGDLQCLQNGVRGLMLDMYDFRNDIWLCHSFRGVCYDFTAFVSIGIHSETLSNAMD